MKKNIHFKQLDTLRFISFLLVFWHHGFRDSFIGITDNQFLSSIITQLTFTGNIGVSLFFVISGFIITYLMVEENKTEGKFNIRFFYFRRFLRIWPLYYLVMIIGIFILPRLFNTFEFDGDVLKNLFFLNNFDMNHSAQHIGIAWSVAIEEQFYIIWPLFFMIFKKKSNLILVCTLTYLSSLIYLVGQSNPQSFGSFENAHLLMIGCLGGLLFEDIKKLLGKIVKRKYLIPFILSFLVLLAFSGDSSFMNKLFQITAPLFYLYFVFYAVLDNSESSSWFSRLGKFTYGMYLYHQIILMLLKITFEKLHLDYASGTMNFVLGISGLIITIFVSLLSYNYFEKIFLNLKKKYSIIKTME